jgi:hypothetical protein
VQRPDWRLDVDDDKESLCHNFVSLYEHHCMHRIYRGLYAGACQKQVPREIPICAQATTVGYWRKYWLADRKMVIAGNLGDRALRRHRTSDMRLAFVALHESQFGLSPT